MISAFFDLLRRCLALAIPYGRGKLVLVLVILLGNGFMQVVGVTSIFPFFALAADPDRIRNSRFGSAILSVLPPMDHSTLLLWAGGVSIALLFLSNAFTLAGEIIRNRYGHGLGHFLRTNMLENFSRRPYGYFLENNSGALLQKLLGDVMNFVTGVFLPMLEALSRLVTLAFLLFTIFLVQPFIALGAGILLGGFYGGLFLLLRRRSRLLGERLQQANTGSHITAQHFIHGIKPIMVHGVFGNFIRSFSRHSGVQARLNALLPLYGNGPRYLVEPIAFGGLVFLVSCLAAKGRSFDDILPNLTVIALAAYRILPSLQLLYAQLTHINAMRYTVAEMESEIAVFTSKNTMVAEAGQVPPLPFNREIRLENISFIYPSAKEPVLQDFNLTIQKNNSLGIIGTTGSGKSTLVDLLLGLHIPQQGSICVDGNPLAIKDFPAWRSIIGYVPQDIYLLDASVAENIAFGISLSDIDHDRLKSAARSAQIIDFIEKELPQNWDTLVGERGVRLSGGQRQRIGLARALYLRPQILLLDEATSALDMETEAAIMETINHLQKSVTMIIIAHRMSTLNGCDQIVRLQKVAA